ncbi:MAG: hypothetical protein M3250_05460, partial [Thermoproteota archaeon]|nr:hypothetical protein [Thermoproteota archaeon]
MKIGYPCINNSVPHTSPSTFRLVSYSENRMIQTIRDNLIHLNQILKYNVKNNLLFFRISSDPLDDTAKVQIHVGRVYGNKVEAKDRFIKTYNNNSKLLVSDDVDSIKRRLVIENDDRLYSLKDCLQISQQTGIPIVFDSFHHECYSNDDEEQQLLPQQIALQRAMSTWKSSEDGLP